MSIFSFLRLHFMTTGDLIKNRRKALNMTQTELADKANIAQSSISQIENDVSGNVTIGNLRSIAKALNCALVELLPEADKRL